MNKNNFHLLYGKKKVQNLTPSDWKQVNDLCKKIEHDFFNCSLSSLLGSMLIAIRNNDQYCFDLCSWYDSAKSNNCRKKSLLKLIEHLSVDCEDEYFAYYNDLTEQIDSQDGK